MNRQGSLAITFLVIALSVGVLIVAYVMVPPSGQVGVLVFSMALVLAAISSFLWLLFSPVHRFLRQLHQIQVQIKESSMAELRESYQRGYAAYLHLSERGKKASYPQLLHLREQLEHILMAERELQSLLQKAPGTLAQEKKRYESLVDLLHQLPEKSQQEYYSQVMHLKENLEQGK